MKTTITTLVLAALAGSASAQCNVYWYGIPDFDQRRDMLPGGGSMYCAPTAALNLMAFIANHGRPEAMGGYSSPNWAGAGEYPLVSQLDYAMGAWMDTTVTGGTNLSGAINGLRDYRDAHGVPAVIDGKANNENWQVSPKLIHDCLKNGWLVTMSYGRYKEEDGAWVRKGGHVVTVCSVQDACGQTPVIGFKDPWTDATDSLAGQSPFATKLWTVIKRVRNFGGQVYYQWGKYGEFDAETQRYIDCIVVIKPLFVLTLGPSDTLVRYSAKLLNNDPTPAQREYTIPDGHRVRWAAADPRRAASFVVTFASSSGPARLWSCDLADGQFTFLLDLPVLPRAFAVDRHGDVLVELNGEIHKYRYLDEGGVQFLGNAVTGAPRIDSISVDDATDDVYALSMAERRLFKYPGGDLSVDSPGGALPGALILGNNPSVAFNPVDGMPWVCSTASTTLYKLDPSAHGWTINSTVDIGVLVRSLQFGDRGQMMFLAGGDVQEYELGEDGGYVRAGDPHFFRWPAQSFLSLARTQHNYDPVIHSGPAWDNIEDPDPDTPETLDCRADYNVDGFVTGDDFDQFVAAFELGQPGADIDGNGFVNGEDFDVFVEAFESGC